MTEEEILKRSKDIVEGPYGETLTRGTTKEKDEQQKMTVSTPDLKSRKEGK